MSDDKPEDLDYFEWENNDEKFAFRVTSDAMIGDQIREGDYVVIRKANTAEDGQIVAFRDFDGTALLRRVQHIKDSPNHYRVVSTQLDKFPTRIISNREILGVLVGVVRKY